MAFAVEDFHDLLKLLDAHPEWQAELRQRVLTEALLGVPDRLSRVEAALERIAASLQEAAAAQARTDERLAELAAAQAASDARTDEQLAELAAAQAASDARLDARMEELAAAQAASDARLDARMEELAAAQAASDARLDARMEELAAAQAASDARLDARMEELAAAHAASDARLDARMEELAAAQARTEAQMAELAAAQVRTETRVGSLRGELLEYWFREKGAAALLRMGLKRARVIDVNDWIAEVDEAVDRGEVSSDERQDLLHVDTVVWGRDAQGEVYVAVEVSATVDVHDVHRASRRARILGRVYGRARAAVAGYRITAGAQQAIADGSDIMVVTRAEPA